MHNKNQSTKQDSTLVGPHVMSKFKKYLEESPFALSIQFSVYLHFEFVIGKSLRIDIEATLAQTDPILFAFPVKAK